MLSKCVVGYVDPTLRPFLVQTWPDSKYIQSLKIQSKPSVPHLLAAVLKFRYHFSCCAHSSLGYLIATPRATTAPSPATAPLPLVRQAQERLEVRFVPGPSVSLARRGAVWRTLAMRLHLASRFPLRAAGGVFWNLPECTGRLFPN